MFNDIQHISCRRGRKFDHSCATGILKPQLMGVQHLPGGPFNRSPAIQGIA
jgi:hypothetical protein